jgi:glycerol-3-phosphate cytidylyltransferase
MSKLPKISKIGFTASTFDLFHAGHISMLCEAKSQCDYLIVAIQTDPSVDRPEKNKPIQSIIERQIQVKGCKYVDDIIVYTTEKDLEDILKTFNISIRILGDEYKHKQYTGKDICVDRGIEIYYNKRDHDFSSSSLRKRVYDAELLKAERKFVDV